MRDIWVEKACAQARDHIERELESRGESLVFLFKAGSDAYGLTDELSDLDLVGIYIPNRLAMFGLGHRREQFSFKLDVDGNKVEGTVYDIRKAVALMLDSNPNMLDIMFCAERSIIYASDLYRALRAHRSHFISNRIYKSFRGYASTQLRRIESHRKWITGTEPRKPSRADYGLGDQPELPVSQIDVLNSILAIESITDEMRDDIWSGLHSEFNFQVGRHFSGAHLSKLCELYVKNTKYWFGAVKTLAGKVAPEALEVASREFEYSTALANYQSFSKWKSERNPARADLEAKVGYDCKHASHVIRLYTQSSEIVRTGEIQVDRTGIDAEFLIRLKRGHVPYDEFMKHYTDVLEESDGLSQVVNFTPNPDIINNIVAEYLVELSRR